jgi:hypothetical protein
MKMRTHPPAFVKPILSCRACLSRAVSSSSVRGIHFPSVRASPSRSRLCAILLLHHVISAPLRHDRASSSCVRLSSVSCAVCYGVPCFLRAQRACARIAYLCFMRRSSQASCAIACDGAAMLLLLQRRALRAQRACGNHAPLLPGIVRHHVRRRFFFFSVGATSLCSMRRSGILRHCVLRLHAYSFPCAS